MSELLDKLFGPDPDVAICARCRHGALYHGVGCKMPVAGKICECTKFEEGPRR